MRNLLWRVRKFIDALNAEKNVDVAALLLIIACVWCLLTSVLQIMTLIYGGCSVQ